MGDASGELIGFDSFIRARFKGDKARLCVYILDLNKTTRYRYKYTANFFRSRTFDQLVDFCVRITTGVEDGHDTASAVSELEVK